MDLLTAIDIADFLNSSLIGDAISITHVSSADNNISNSISFIKKDLFKEDTLCKKLFLVTHTKTIPKTFSCSYIKVNNPRLAFAKVVARFFNTSQSTQILSECSEGVLLGNNVSIGQHCYIGRNVSIGDNTIIKHNVVIEDDTIIGKDCYIKSNSTIGEDGFGFDFDDSRIPIRLPHLGKVVIKDNVEIGACCTIAKGTINDTIIYNHVKVDDNVHISHNCIIGEKTIITAQALLSGSVKIGKKVWVGPNSSVIQKVTIHDDALIGIGAIITKEVSQKTKMMGLESLPLKILLKFKKKIGY